jgi:hypothetical protein
LVEGVGVHQVDERHHRDTGRLQIDEEVADPPVLRRLLIRAGEQDHPLGEVPLTRPDLLAVDDVIIAVAHRPRLQRGEVRPCPRLGEALTPQHLRPRDRRQMLRPLLLRPPDHQGWTDQLRAKTKPERRTRPGHLFVVDQLLDV